METLFYPLSDGDIKHIREGGFIEQHFHLRQAGIDALLVVVGKSKKAREDYQSQINRGISVTSIPLSDKQLKQINSKKGAVEVGYPQFRVVIVSTETLGLLTEKLKGVS